MATTPFAGLGITVDEDGPLYSIALSGEFDVANADQVEAALRRAERSGADTILVDLSGLAFIDSTGIGVLSRAAERCEAAGQVLGYLRGPDPIHRVFELTGLAEHLPFLD
jgi:anti-anti-sigma factor